MDTIESTSIEKRRAKLTARVDPTAVIVEFQATTGARVDPDGTWKTGAWEGTWDQANGRVDALTPTMGAPTADLPLTAGLTYDVWARWTVGGETPVLLCGSILVR
jgi:hypothetical protein